MSKRNLAHNKLINNTAYSSTKKGNTFMFDTSRFTEVTTNRQLKNGTTTYRDNSNPGVFYTSHSSGYVRRVIKTVVKQENSQGIHTYNENRAYQINPRGNNNSTLMISKGNQRLARIQEMADKFNSRNPSITSIYTRGDQTTTIIPNI